MKQILIALTAVFMLAAPAAGQTPAAGDARLLAAIAQAQQP